MDKDVEVPSPRRTRSRTKAYAAAAVDKAKAQLPPDPESSDDEVQVLREVTKTLSISASRVRDLPDLLKASDTGLSRSDHALLLKKQSRLKTWRAEDALPSSSPSLRATLVFAQEAAGTAVCIHESGILLTCSHCVPEPTSAPRRQQSHWLLFATGRVVKTRCIAWDERRDLALLRVVAAQGPPTLSTPLTGEEGPSFSSMEVAESAPRLNARLVCVGHPGSEDLEAEEEGVATGYDVLVVSTGRFRGCAEGQDPQDNSEIGALMHNCWTYWGHSGAPLVDAKSGELVGLHSSWDDETGMRRGVALEAIAAFLEEHQHLLPS